MTYPFSPLIALLLAGLILAFARRRWLRRIGIAMLALGWLGSTPVVANFMIGALESRAGESSENCHDLEAVVLLTGGLVRKPASPLDVQALNGETLQRAMGLLDRDDPALPLVIAGGGYFKLSEAELVDNFIRRAAPGRAAALLETTSRNTWENAVHTARLLPPPRRIALATSALHLPRARLAFETVGYSVCPWPLNSLHLRAVSPWALLPHISAVRKTEAVLHELGGWIVYGWREAPDSGE